MPIGSFVPSTAGGDSVSNSPSAVATGSVTGVLNGVLTTVVTYTVVTGITRIVRVACSGNIYGKFELINNLTVQEKLRSGPDRNLHFGSLDVNVGDIVEVKVTHFNASITGDFDVTLWAA